MIPESIQSTITFLKTRDIEATTRFYTQVLGFRLALDQGGCRIFAIRQGAYIGFCQTDGSTGSPEVVFTLVLDDVDAACAAVEKAGGSVEVRPRKNLQYNIYQCFIRDPNGYMIEIQRFLDPAWDLSTGIR
jgi:catechol 2,3-dioxygenase-like lactoylglutathione lyase family enzyme